MLTARWDPRGMWSEMNRLRTEMNDLFGRYGDRRVASSVYPPLNLWEDESNLFVEAELPGFDMNDLEITVTGDNQLSIKGDRKQPEHEGGTWHRQERGYGTFSRLVELPEHVEAGNVTAEFKHGVLTITLPKKEEVKPRRIEVKSS
jgi:HSP20 family protein